MSFDALHHAHTSDPDTSHEAARAARGLSERHKAIIRDVLLLARSFRGGLTSAEISEHCELEYLQVARRMNDLKRDGKVVDTGQRRASPSGNPAAVWGLV